MDERAAESVLRAAECIPAGRVAPYSVLARITGTSARFVGRVMAVHGGAVPWWRVTDVRGALPAALARRAEPHWQAEGIVRRDGRVDMAAVQADEEELAACWSSRAHDLISGADVTGSTEPHP